MSDIDRLIHDLSVPRAEFGRVGDDYRQARIDVAISQLEECRDVKAEYKDAGMWESWQNDVGERV